MALARRPAHAETLQVFFTYAVMLAVVGLLESTMTAAIVDHLMDMNSDRDRESPGQRHRDA